MLEERKKINCNYRVLIVDDEPDILELMQDEFEYHGFNVDVAECGNDAVMMLDETKYDVVVSDYKMPNGNGMVVLEKVKSIELPNKPVFYFISGQADVSDDDAIKAGAEKFFAKPFDLESLVVEIESYFKRTA